jgi:polysaccharide export outer membrane protein
MTTRILPFIATILFLNSCKTSNILEVPRAQCLPSVSHLDSAFFFNPNYQYFIRKDDKVNISVWGQDELSVGSVYGIYNSNEVYGKWLMVDANGNIEVPKLGTMNVLGLTVPLLKDTLKNLFSRWIVNPIVDVKILNKEITVLGEVRNPQVILVDKDRNNLLEMIARCGGLEFYANLKHIKVLRQDGVNVRVANIDLRKGSDYLYKNIQLFPGDIVVVPSKNYKEFDKRISTIIPFTSTATAAAILLKAF